MFWRPVHAITRADTDGNVATLPDATWRPLLNVNHPEYPSAHSCGTGAVTGALDVFFGPGRYRFTVDSLVAGTSRSYASFGGALDEVTEARIWAGLHLRHSMEDGAKIAQQAVE
jgi:hypothetical protein